MKTIKRNLLFIAIAFMITGCWEVTEEITINKDGSGTYVNKLDISKYIEQYETLSAMDSSNKQMIPDFKKALDSSFRLVVLKYKLIKGVSSAKLDTSITNLYTISFNFSDVDVLNMALDSDKKEKTEKELYSWSKGTLVRKGGGVNMIDELTETEGEQNELMDSYTSEMHYKLIYHLPGAVKKMSNDNALLSDDKKTVTLETNFNDVKKNAKLLMNEVKYK
ncbi:MAG: hypothetical protein WBC06_11275 [Chitinophagaceae bacterium]